MVKMQCDGITKKGDPCQRWVTYHGWNVGHDGGIYCKDHRGSTSNFIPVQNADPKTNFLEEMAFLLIILVCFAALFSIIVAPLETVSICSFAFLLLIIVNQIRLFDKT